MKKNKEGVDERAAFSWEEFEKEHAAARRQQEKKEKLEWDRPLVDETWTIDEEVIYKATLDEDLDLSAEISRKLDSVADARPVDEQAIRSSVDRKIVIKSEECKGKRAKLEDAPKRKVRRRIPKAANSEKNGGRRQRMASEEKKKQKYQPLESGQDNKMSAFRERSMDWKNQDPVHHGVDGEAADLPGAFSRIVAHFKRYTALEWVSVVLAVIIVASSAMTSAVYASYKGEENKARAIASLKQYATVEDQRVAETVVEEEEPAAGAAPDEIVEIKTLSLVLTSVEKDLKIKLVDQDDALVKNVPWGVTVTDENGKVSD
ncbi:MAG: hypothetical protein IKS87_01765, partial [Lachnospiraceae bacterium]|nr:hypothetical protein [Lachnospiraceae bacterium]